MTKILPARIPLLLSPQEKRFVLFVAVLGLTGGEAYRLAFKSDANNASATVMASKLLRDERMQNAIRRLFREYSHKGFAFNNKLVRY